MQTSQTCSDAQFLRLLANYRPFGGLMRCSELQRLGAAAGIAGSAASVRWSAWRWYPCFQFRRAPWRLCPHVENVVAHLSPVMDDREVVEWLVSPNCWLHDLRPVDLLLSSPQCVMEAARTDRYVVGG